MWMNFGKHGGGTSQACPPPTWCGSLPSATASRRLPAAARDAPLRRGVSPEGRRGRGGGGEGASQAGHCPTCVRVIIEINAEFRRLALACHLGRGGTDQVLAAVKNAFEQIQAMMR